MGSYRVAGCTELVGSWLEDESHGLNVQLAALRLKISEPIASLPDVATFRPWLHETHKAKALTTPLVSWVPVGYSDEKEPNSRVYSVTFEVTAVVTEKRIGGQEWETARAAWLYHDALKDLHDLRGAGKPHGRTLFGGMNTASGRVIRSTMGQARLVRDRGISAPNFGVRTTLVVQMAENFE